MTREQLENDAMVLLKYIHSHPEVKQTYENLSDITGIPFNTVRALLIKEDWKKYKPFSLDKLKKHDYKKYLYYLERLEWKPDSYYINLSHRDVLLEVADKCNYGIVFKNDTNVKIIIL